MASESLLLGFPFGHELVTAAVLDLPNMCFRQLPDSTRDVAAITVRKSPFFEIDGSLEGILK